MPTYVSVMELAWKPSHYVIVTAETIPAAEKAAQTIALMVPQPANHAVLPQSVVSLTFI